MEKMDQLKAEFHKELHKLRCDLGGSLADMVEDALAAAIRRVEAAAVDEEK